MHIDTKFVLLAGIAAAVAYTVVAIRRIDTPHEGHSMVFRYANPSPVAARDSGGVQKETITIDGGYSPAQISVRAGKPVELAFYRKEQQGCADTLVIKDLKIRKQIAAGETAVVKFTPGKPGVIPFECGMGMISGQIVVTKA